MLLIGLTRLVRIVKDILVNNLLNNKESKYYNFYRFSN